MSRSKPVELAKRLKIRPQIIYGLIKRGKVKTFPNAAGGPDLVDDQEVTIVVSRMSKRGPRKEKAERTGKAPRGIKRGTIISRDKFPIKGAFARENGGSRAIQTVTDPGRGEGSLVWLSDGTVETFWSTDTLAKRLQEDSVKLESVPALLGMITFQWREEGHTDRAEAFERYLTEMDIHFVPIDVAPKNIPKEEVQEEPKEEAS